MSPGAPTVVTASPICCCVLSPASGDTDDDLDEKLRLELKRWDIEDIDDVELERPFQTRNISISLGESAEMSIAEYKVPRRAIKQTFDVGELSIISGWWRG